jgi:hypothetical protein
MQDRDEVNKLKETHTAQVERSKQEGLHAQEEIEALKAHVTKIWMELVQEWEPEKASFSEKAEHQK